MFLFRELVLLFICPPATSNTIYIFLDFSWGATRKIAGVDNGHGDGGMDVFDPKQVPMRKWHEWKMDEGQRRFAPKY